MPEPIFIKLVYTALSPSQRLTSENPPWCFEMVTRFNTGHAQYHLASFVKKKENWHFQDGVCSYVPVLDSCKIRGRTVKVGHVM
jgi:hypothetical protein